jgi:adenylosuccinate synthase
VGGGPFPTEQDNDIGNYIRERGNEYRHDHASARADAAGLDAVALKYSVDLCGITAVALTLIDVLSGLDRVQICTGYKHHGTRLPILPRRHGYAGRS